MFSLSTRHSRYLSLVIVLGLVAAGTARAQRDDDIYKNSGKVLSAFKSVVAKPSESTVRVRCDGKDAAYGTVVNADGWIVTKASELKSPIICKLKDGRELEAKIVGVHEKYDVAMLKVDAKDLKPIEWGNTKDTSLGNWVASPGLGENPIAVGVVSVATRKGIDRFIPNPKSGFLGIALPQTEDVPRIDEVIKDTAAAKAGLEKGDLILTVDGEEMKDGQSVPKKLGKYKPGDEVTLKIKRGDEVKEFKIKLGKRPTEPSDDLMGPVSDRKNGFPTFLEHDTVLKPSDCGGPLVDLDGKALGVNIARAGRYETYAIPAEALTALLPDLMSGKLAVKVPDATEKLKDLKDSISKIETQRDSLQKKIDEAKDLIKKTEKDKADLEKKLTEARDALKKLEKEIGNKGSNDNR
jgi:serine protease Do